MVTTAVKATRGRPKGSLNRPKEVIAAEKAAREAARAAAGGKRKPGRPIGSKNKPKVEIVTPAVMTESENHAVRVWAAANNHVVSPRGRISASVKEAYALAHSKKAKASKVAKVEVKSVTAESEEVNVNKVMREWAASKNMDVPARGRLPKNIIEQFDAAHAKKENVTETAKVEVKTVVAESEEVNVNKVMREWAASKNMDVPARGRLPKTIIEQFDAAHAKNAPVTLAELGNQAKRGRGRPLGSKNKPKVEEHAKKA